MKEINKTYNKLAKDYRRSFFLYTSLSITLFVLSATLVVLNLFAIRMNPNQTLHDASLKHEQYYFIAIVVLTAIAGTISGFLSLFTFKKKARIQRVQIDRINNEVKKYRKSIEDYKEEKHRDKKFVKNIKAIFNEEF